MKDNKEIRMFLSPLSTKWQLYNTHIPRGYWVLKKFPKNFSEKYIAFLRNNFLYIKQEKIILFHKTENAIYAH